MAKITASTQGVDRDFNYTGSYDLIERGEVGLTKAREFMRALPDQGGVSRDFLEGVGDLCPPNLLLSSYRTVVKKRFFRKKEVEEDVQLSVSGGGKNGKVSFFLSWHEGHHRENARRYVRRLYGLDRGSPHYPPTVFFKDEDDLGVNRFTGPDGFCRIDEADEILRNFFNLAGAAQESPVSFSEASVAMRHPPKADTPQAASMDARNVVEELERLDALLQRGALTREEFDQLKAELLKR